MFERCARGMLVIMLIPVIAALLVVPFMPMLVWHTGPDHTVGSALANLIRSLPEKAPRNSP